jgi:hypothetical protein
MGQAEGNQGDKRQGAISNLRFQISKGTIFRFFMPPDLLLAGEKNLRSSSHLLSVFLRILKIDSIGMMCQFLNAPVPRA